jgi:mRNA interferase RelE/StbE
MAYTVEFRPAARREFLRLTPEVQARIKPEIEALADTPRPLGCQKLGGSENLWRIRVGDYRIVYQVHDRVLLVVVVRIAHRREAYR